MANETITIQEGPDGKWLVKIAGTRTSHGSFEIAKTVALKHFEQDDEVSLVAFMTKEEVFVHELKLNSKREEARKKFADALQAFTFY